MVEKPIGSTDMYLTIPHSITSSIGVIKTLPATHFAPQWELAFHAWHVYMYMPCVAKLSVKCVKYRVYGDSTTYT